MNEQEVNWDDVRDLARRVSSGEPFTLTAESRAILQRTGPQVGIPQAEVEKALRSEASAATLLTEVSRRIRDGSNRLSRALSEATRRQEANDLDGARQLLRDVVEDEVVPLYRDIAQIQLEALDEE
ncbi:DUSAM domain-containing protein [Corallococcus sp. AB049A]|uniref:DUSAM domain-containing protein n=1 Tax=Corallococcus interemptor TaxID=2316720 RepID=A0A3A8QC28_9BACT|nr:MULTISPECIES: DUSAM domain-containing protein [Corallococcus]RKH37949.1 DUSAM domain-containing protein [Corallococcus sp. AB050B]RKH62322.1 DUSAM domain-containing protein [Corallococcus interemptor]RKI44967.1 DUSAM domain-containing protein [Corallococcus sp. AB049A]